MIETALNSFTTFFATIGPPEAAILFATLTPKMPPDERRKIAVRATAIASIILAFFTLLGGPILAQLGVTIPALQVAGGVVLMLIAIDMIFARPDGALKLSRTEGEEAQLRDDVAVFPMATPLLAGPGAMSAGILLAAGTHGDAVALATVTASLAVVMLITLVLLLLAHEISHVLSLTAQRVLVRVFGLLLSAIAVQALFNGIKASGLLHS